MNPYDLDFPRFHGAPPATGVIRSLPEDFQVDEQLGFEPEGRGEHLFVLLRKRGENTQWIARQLAELAGIKPVDVNYAGLKDRHAVTTQWFSLWLPGQPDPDLSGLPDTVSVLKTARHSRKLKRGGHRCNRFVSCSSMVIWSSVCKRSVIAASPTILVSSVLVIWGAI